MKFRRHVPTRPVTTPGAPRISQPRQAVNWTRYRLHAGLFAGAALAGYLVAALVLFPAPIFVANATVPRVIGLVADSATDALAKASLKSKNVERLPHPRAPAGQVIWQDPPAGVVVNSGTTVELSVSDGPQRVLVPDVAGYDGALARLLLESAGLTAGVESTQTAAPKGVTVNTRPSAGAAVSPGGRVTLVVSRGAPTISVPVLTGLTLGDARTRLEQAGLSMGTSFARTSPTGEPGTVIDQHPAGGTLAAPGTVVDVTLARRSSP